MEETSPIITVCVPVYNAASYVLRCIRSLFAQTISDMAEFIFVDDASQDGSADIIETTINSHPEVRGTLLRHNKNRGQTAARLTAFSASSGTYIAFVDCDDYLDARYLETLLKKAQDSDADVVFSGMIHEYKNKSISQNTRIQKINCEDKGVAAMLSLDVNLATKLIKKELLTEHPDVFNKSNISYGEDMFVVSRLCHYAKSVTTVNECLYHYVHTNVGQTTSKKKGSDRLWSGMKSCMNATVAFFNKAYPDGKYEDILEYVCVERKCTLCIFHSDITDIQKHADWLYDVEMRHANKLPFLKNILIAAIHYRMWLCASIILHMIRFGHTLHQLIK